ncbi:hypothetical protein GCM10027090_05220 [Sinomonas soli]
MSREGAERVLEELLEACRAGDTLGAAKVLCGSPVAIQDVLAVAVRRLAETEGRRGNE